jgi:hypothetical protein
MSFLFIDFNGISDNNLDLLVNTTNCRIPNFNIWDKTIYDLVKGKKVSSPCNWYNWSSIQNNVRKRRKMFVIYCNSLYKEQLLERTFHF